MLLIYGHKIYNYVYQSDKMEVTPTKQFKQFQCAWLEFIYNITYRRAHINSFGALYRILKFSKGNTTNY